MKITNVTAFIIYVVAVFVAWAILLADYCSSH